MFFQKNQPTQNEGQNPKEAYSIGKEKKIVLNVRGQDRAELRKMLAQIDIDHNGNITYEEWSKNNAVPFKDKSQFLVKLGTGELNSIVDSEPLKEEIKAVKEKTGSTDENFVKASAIREVLSRDL